MNLWENIRLALLAIRSNLLRTSLTFMIIAIGITALVGILTAIDSIEASITQNFSSMGSNTFSIRKRGTSVSFGGGRKKVNKTYPRIRYEEAMRFAGLYDFPSTLSISNRPSWASTVKYQNKKTNPNVSVFGVDEPYLTLGGFSLKYGRNFSPLELNSGSNVVIIGYDVALKLFSKMETAIGEQVSLGAIKYTVIGILEPKGSSFMSNDNMVWVPLLNTQRIYPEDRMFYVISVAVNNPLELDPAISDATGLMRVARGLRPEEENDFEISRSDNLASELIGQLKYISMGATLIGLVTLLGAAIGLMNIMLVSISERTREIGISKAIGAKKQTILVQFLTESVVISLIGGALGIVLGILVGNSVSSMLDGSFLFPWKWIGAGFFFCTIVGLVAGIYPAFKAAGLDPIEALRYE